MADTFTSARSFGGGEVTPEFFGRIDDSKYQSGLALCRNFTILPHGPAVNRPGTRFVNYVKNPTAKTRIIPFYYSDDQTLIIEMGAGYFRFHTQGATVLSAGVPYEVAHPYTDAEIFDVNFVQSADVMTFAHHNHAPAELRRLGATNWTMTNIDFSPSLLPPTSVTATAHAGATPGTPTTQEYVVTAIAGGGTDESRGSLSAFVNNNLYDDGAYNSITWPAVAGAVRYCIYKKYSGQFAYIGSCNAPVTSFIDDNIAPDLGKTAPTAFNPFATAGNYPSVVTYFDQRRVFAATDNLPQTVWMTKTGTERNMDSSFPAQDTDSISFRAAARDGNRVRHLVPMDQLVMFTASTVWRVNSQNSDALTPVSIGVRPQASAGSSYVRPIVVNSNCVYVASRGGHLREMGYSYNAGGYTTADASMRAPHLFDNADIIDMAFQAAPYPYVWMVSSTGELIGFTYVPEQQVGAFHHHDTINGHFQSVAVVPEGDEDAVYVVVLRDLPGGSQTTTIERFGSRKLDPKATTATDGYFVDCGATYSGAPSTNISGLTWLEGQTVSILADGAVVPQQVVTGGTVTLDNPASTVHVGLPITADLQTLPLYFQIPGYGSGKPKVIAATHLGVYQSSGIFAGSTFDDLYEAKQRSTENYGSPPQLKSEDIEIVVDGGWDDTGQICIRQVDPLPLTILSVTLDVALGG